MAVTPVLFEQIEKFHCLNPSTTQGLSTGTLRLHVATCHVSENVSKFFNFDVKLLQKPKLFDLTVNEVFLYTLLAFRKHMSLLLN